MRHRRPLAAAVLAALSLPGAGCSAIFVKPPPSGRDPDGEQIACTSSVAAPVADAVVGGAAAIAGAAMVVNAAGDGKGTTQVLGGLVLLGAAAFGASAYRGFADTARCREARRAVAGCPSGDVMACRATTPWLSSAPGAR